MRGRENTGCTPPFGAQRAGTSCRVTIQVGPPASASRVSRSLRSTTAAARAHWKVAISLAESNVELARHGYQAVLRGEFEILSEMLASDVKWHGGDPSAEGACQNRTPALEVIRSAYARGAIGQLVDVLGQDDKVVVILRPPVQPGTSRGRREGRNAHRQIPAPYAASGGTGATCLDLASDHSCSPAPNIRDFPDATSLERA